ncbi:helix-turn-helix domain-containing protein [Micromonospora sp. NPDC004704]
MSALIDLLVEELIAARTSRGMTQEEWARQIKFSPTHVSSVETQHRPPTTDYVAAIDKAFQTGGVYTRLLAKFASIEAEPVWHRDWLVHEQRATLLRWFEPLYLPGMLQTEAYARQVLRDARISSETAEQLLASRLERQEALKRDRPTRFVFVIDETILYRPIVHGRPEMMVEQLEHLLTCAEQANIDIHLVPREAGVYPGLQGAFIMATYQDGTVVSQVDHQVRAQVLTGADDIVTLQGLWEAIRSDSLPRAQSIELIKKAVKAWTT